MIPIRLAVATVLLLAFAPPALAQVVIEQNGGPGTAFSKNDWPTQSLPRQPLTLAPGLIELGVPARVDVSKTNPGVPDWSLPLYLDVGVLNGLQVGVWHQTGLCLAGVSGGCGKVYDDAGGRARVSLGRFGSASQLALDVSVLASGFSSDTTAWIGTGALLYKIGFGNLAFLADVDWSSRFNQRGSHPFADQFAANAGAQVEIVPGLAAYGKIGVSVPINKTTIENLSTAKVQGPVSFGVEIAPVKPVAVGAALEFPNLVGDGATGDVRDVLAYARIWF